MFSVADLDHVSAMPQLPVAKVLFTFSSGIAAAVSSVCDPIAHETAAMSRVPCGGRPPCVSALRRRHPQ